MDFVKFANFYGKYYVYDRCGQLYLCTGARQIYDHCGQFALFHFLFNSYIFYLNFQLVSSSAPNLKRIINLCHNVSLTSYLNCQKKKCNSLEHDLGDFWENRRWVFGMIGLNVHLIPNIAYYNNIVVKGC